MPKASKPVRRPSGEGGYLARDRSKAAAKAIARRRPRLSGDSRTATILRDDFQSVIEQQLREHVTDLATRAAQARQAAVSEHLVAYARSLTDGR